MIPAPTKMSDAPCSQRARNDEECQLVFDYHEALKSDARWLVETVPVPHVRAGEPCIQDFGEDGRFELRNCRYCHSTLLREIR